MKKTVIMGIGNLLLSDDGIGVHAVKVLKEGQLPEQVEVLDVGTAFMDALPALEQVEKIIVIDAITADMTPGFIYRIPLEKCKPRPLDTLHNFDIFAMLTLAGNPHPVQVVVLGVEPEKLDWGTELSATVSQVLPNLIAHVVEEIEM